MPKDMNKLQKILDEDLKKQTKEGLAKIYTEIGCTGVAKEIKAGRKVTDNAEFGIRACIHEALGPRANPQTLKFYPQSKKNIELEKKFVNDINKLLENAGYKKMSSSLLSDLRKKDKRFEKDFKNRIESQR